MFRGSLVVLALLTGCDDFFSLAEVTQGPPDAHIDAAGLDPCNPAATVSGSIHFQGAMLDSSDSSPVFPLSIDLMPGGSAPTNSVGAFAIDSPTTNTPLFASLTTSGGTGYPTHRIYYQRPFTTSTADVSNKLFKDTTITGLYLGTGISRDTEHATALVSLRDCTGNGVAGATLSVSNASVVYQGGGQTTDGTGVAYVMTIVPGDVEFDTSAAAPFTAVASKNDMLLVFLIVP